MPAKIRLTRHGRKKRPYYHIVISDSRAPRDGRYIERIGLYDPGTNPATIELDFDRALEWLQKGAQPTDTCRAILSYKGVLIKNHLLKGVKKGAFSEEEAEVRFNTWLKNKENEILTKKSKVLKAFEEEEKKRFEIEKKIQEARSIERAEKNAELAKEEKAKTAEEASVEPKKEAPVETQKEVTVEQQKEASVETKKEVAVEQQKEASVETKKEVAVEPQKEAPVEPKEEKKEEANGRKE